MNKPNVRQRGEVFTPTALVSEMLDKLVEYSPDVFTDNKTYLDPSCGNGQFLVEVLNKKMLNGISHQKALSTIYGIDIDFKNVEECKKRLLKGKTNKQLIQTVDRNIICADALNANHPGWAKVGYMWEPNPFFG